MLSSSPQLYEVNAIGFVFQLRRPKLEPGQCFTQGRRASEEQGMHGSPRCFIFPPLRWHSSPLIILSFDVFITTGLFVLVDKWVAQLTVPSRPWLGSGSFTTLGKSLDSFGFSFCQSVKYGITRTIARWPGHVDANDNVSVTGEVLETCKGRKWKREREKFIKEERRLFSEQDRGTDSRPQWPCSLGRCDNQSVLCDSRSTCSGSGWLTQLSFTECAQWTEICLGPKKRWF